MESEKANGCLWRNQLYKMLARIRKAILIEMKYEILQAVDKRDQAKKKKKLLQHLMFYQICYIHV